MTKAIDIARTAEATQSQLNDIRAAEKPVSVNTLKHSKPQKHSPPQSHPQGKGQDCGNCGTRHSLSQRSLCPAYNSDCNFCHKKLHWEKVCKSKAKSQQPRSQQPRGRPSKPNKKVHTLEKVEPTEQAGNQLYFDTIVVNQISQTKTQALVNMQIDSGQLTRELSCKIDTGAEGNILPIDAYMQLYPNTPLDQDGQPQGLKPSTSKITAFGGHVIKQYGTCLLTLTHRDVTNKCAFHVVDTKGPIILGLPTCSDMKLITLNNGITVSPALAAAPPAPTAADHPADKSSLLREYPKCFEGIGCFEGEFHITLDPIVPPVVHSPRRVPEALREPLKKELDNLEAQGIVSKVTEPTDWVNSLVCVTKSNGSLRLCLDPKDLNKVIKRPHHCTPTIDEVLPRLNGAQYFSIVDARSGYWNIKLDLESSLYTTFNSPHGRYRFLRLPFGLICAQDIFQRKVDETFGDLPGVTASPTTFVIYRNSRAGHDHNLRAVMQRAHEAGIRFNADKCRIGCSELPFFGHIISSTGLKLDPGKVESISNMDPSTNLNDLQTFLGMVQFLSRFIPNLASVAAVLWDLTKSSSEFQWNPEHQEAVAEIKRMITSPGSLQYFDASKPVTIQVDASTCGLGATLLQDKGPVEYRSKLLTETEKRYSNIEREMLGIVHGLEKFHYYAYGRHVTVETDHKPLEAIFKKLLSSAPPRIARMMLRIQKYDVDIKYVPGKDIPLADALSRLNPCPADTIQGLDVCVHELHLHLNASPTRVRQIQEETAKDPNLTPLRSTISHGWPDKRSVCPPHLHGYWNYRDELTVYDGLILKGTRIVIPKSLQSEVLKQIHYAHQGFEKCKLRAKGSVFWTNINADIDETVKSCAPCQHTAKMNTKEPMTPHDVPPKPWHTLGSELFFWNNGSYLIIADYYSKFPVVRKLHDITSITVIKHMKSIFEEYGIPEKLVTGHDTQFTSSTFGDFNRTYGFEHTTTSPYYPQANGFVERNVQIVKNLLQKCKESGSDPHLAILCLRTTPVDHHLPSPAELLNNRMYQSNLPGVSRPVILLI